MTVNDEAAIFARLQILEDKLRAIESVEAVKRYAGMGDEAEFIDTTIGQEAAKIAAKS